MHLLRRPGISWAARYNLSQVIEGIEVDRVYTSQGNSEKWSRSLKVIGKGDDYRYDFDIDKEGIISVPESQGMSNPRANLASTLTWCHHIAVLNL